MSRRASEGAKIIRFFENEPYDKASFVYDMVRDTMNERRKVESPPATKRARKKKDVSAPAPNQQAPVPAPPHRTTAAD